MWDEFCIVGVGGVGGIVWCVRGGCVLDGSGVIEWGGGDVGVHVDGAWHGDEVLGVDDFGCCVF